jgi:uncharacterized protein
MSAAQPKSSEPSMEEILASIRRIIADEPQKAAAAPAAPPPAANAPAPAPAEDDEVMELRPKPKAKEPHFITDDPVDNDVSFAEPAKPELPKSQDDIDALMAAAAAEEPPPAPMPEPAPVAPPIATSPPVVATPPLERLISAEADRAAAASFGALTNTILSKNAKTLDDLMQDMMRPMVKQWLDDNLPTVVERLVRAEIERVARGGR